MVLHVIIRSVSILLFLTVLGFHDASGQQKEVAITIDDVPNVMVYKRHGFSAPLLKSINELSLPVTIFINEKNIYNNEFVNQNFTGLLTWLNNSFIDGGNHSFSHFNYADIPLETFQYDIIKGEVITREILKQKHQALTYFRFPYNSLGSDSITHQQINSFLTQRGYTIAPFTIESEDWMFNALYEEALKIKNVEKAHQLGQNYVAFTLQLFDYFEKLCLDRFGRNIKQIYLCHDNQLNTDYLPVLVDNLKKKGYSFIRMDQAMEDNVYRSPDFYFGRAGFSWIYRWEPDREKRKALLQAEPENTILHTEYDQLTKRAGKN